MSQLHNQEHKPLDEQIIDFLNTLQDNHSESDQQWIKTLLEYGANNTSSEIMELGTLIQTTIMDTILAKLLNINPCVLAKAALVEKYICNIWEHNNLHRQELYNPILEDAERQAILQLIQPGQVVETRENFSNDPVIIQQETTIPEVEMKECTVTNETSIKPVLSTTRNNNPIVETQDMDSEVCPSYNNIREMNHYETRNRSYNHLNPYFIT